MRGVLVKELQMGDVEDPMLYAAFPLGEWQETEEYKYIIEHCSEMPTFYCDPNWETHGYTIRIYAPLTGPALTYYKLKYGKYNKTDWK